MIPMIKILACMPNNTSMTFDVVDCASNMEEGGKKDASFIANKMLKKMLEVDARKKCLSRSALMGQATATKQEPSWCSTT